MTDRRPGVAGGVACLILFAGPATGAGGGPDGVAPAVDVPHGFEIVYGDWIDPATGELTGLRTLLPIEPGAVSTDGPAFAAMDNRVDVVVVGDGYTAAQLALFRQHAATALDALFRYEPLASYRPFFRTSVVDVISSESGVDNDPTPGILRNTALDMQFWCNGTERLLCVSTTKARNAARAAVSDVDQIIVLANSTKYGGAGYTSSDIATASGGNSAAGDVVVHEIGHSLGNLADEYTYGGPATYTGPELGGVNVSIYDADEQLARQTKWWLWMGGNEPGYDGPVGTFEGGSYSAAGVYRPSGNSMMRSLYRNFNLVSAEALVRNIYLQVEPIDEVFPPTTGVVGRAQVLEVLVVEPTSHPLEIVWTINGSPAGLEGVTSLDLGALHVPPGATVTVRVTDPTGLMTDEAFRASRMTKSVTWRVTTCPVELTGDGVVDLFDILAFFDLYTRGVSGADFAAPSGELNIDDILAFFAASAQGC